jgi:beta-lactamase class A
MSASPAHSSRRAAHRYSGAPRHAPRSPSPRGQRQTSVVAGIALLLLAAAGVAALLQPLRRALPVLSPRVSQAPATGEAQSAQARPPDIGAIDARLRQDVEGLDGSYAVAVVDLTTGLSYGVNTAASSRAASVNKLPILLTLYQRADDGTLDPDQTVTLTDDDIQHYGTGLIQDPRFGRSFSLRQLAALMIEESDNTAAYFLEHYLGQDAIQANLAGWGLTHTSMSENTTTSADVVRLFVGLNSGKLLRPASYAIVNSLLEHTVFTDRLTAGVPEGVPVAHKVGTDIGVYNDAGVVFAPGHPYAIAVLSQNALETEAEPALVRLSRDVFRFESSLSATPTPGHAR